MSNIIAPSLRMNANGKYVYNAGGLNTHYYSSFIDVLGKKTPRSIDYNDMTFGDIVYIFKNGGIFYEGQFFYSRI